MDINDNGYCVPPRVCAAPSFALWREDGSGATDILLPYMLGVNHSTYDVPWEAKEPRAFFRGRRNEHRHAFSNSSMNASRSTLVALSAAHNDTLDARFVEGENAAPEVPIRDHARRKYLLALDGVTGSFRFSRLLWCNSLVLKESSHWQEYFNRGLTSGVHFQCSRRSLTRRPTTCLPSSRAHRPTKAARRRSHAPGRRLRRGTCARVRAWCT
jgi:hypothetical protein